MSCGSPSGQTTTLGLLGASLLVAATGCSSADPAVEPEPEPYVCYADEPYEPTFGQEDLTFWVGPYLGHTTQSSVAVGWETEQEGDTRLEYGPDQTYGSVVEGDSGTMHQVVVDGLEPGTTYHYRACTGETCSGDLSFATAPESGHPIRFSVWGDTQDNPVTHRTVVDQAIADRPNLAIIAGDLVGDGNFREQYKDRLFDPTRVLAHYIPLYAAIGNHDRKDTEVVHFRDYVMYPETPGSPQAETSYSFVYGDAFFLVLDNTLDHADLFFPLDDYYPPFYLWIEEQLASPAAQGAQWRFVVAHYPPDTSCRPEDFSSGLPETQVRAALLPLFWAHGVHAYFAGHVHCYERFDFDGHLAITTGGGGGGLEPDEQCGGPEPPESQSHRCVHHHITVEMDCGEAEVRARDMDGNLLERIRLLPDGQHEVLESLR